MIKKKKQRNRAKKEDTASRDESETESWQQPVEKQVRNRREEVQEMASAHIGGAAGCGYTSQCILTR